MAIAYPLDLPAAVKFREMEFTPQTVVSLLESPFTFQSQTLVWPGQRWVMRGSLPPLKGTDADAMVAFLLSLNGVQGTFRMGDATRPASLGTAAGAWTVGAGAAALGTNLPIAGGAGAFAVGDWLQIGNYLYNVIKLVDATNVDVWPRLRAAHANGTAITYASAKGLFRLASNEYMKWTRNTVKYNYTEIFAVEAL